jgi:hypothetical protein
MRYLRVLGGLGAGLGLLGLLALWFTPVMRPAQPTAAGGLPTATPTATEPPSGTPTLTVTVISTPSPSPALCLSADGEQVLCTTTPTPTNTPTRPPTGTATRPASPTPTDCPIYFVDVPPAGGFYAYVRCLACRGIVGGYPCGGPGEPCPGAYYRPNNNVTRGQVSKIVAQSAGFADPIGSTQQTFQDVAPGSTFHVYIERLAERGIIGGYPCGGAGEPCVAPTNRAYFRPGNGATRGQTAKIVQQAFFSSLLAAKR